MKTKTYTHPSNPPEIGKIVKLLVVCPEKGKNWSQTSLGYYQKNGHYHIQSYPGEAYKVVGWAELDSNTENYGTETI